MIIGERWARTFPTLLVLLAFSQLPRAAQAQPVIGLRVDGDWCPASHCNERLDDFQQAVPLTVVERADRVEDPRVSPNAGQQLGCATGTALAVCAYNSPAYPALAAYDYQTGGVLWTSPLEDLPESSIFGRVVTGLLVARMSVDGGPEVVRVFAGNQQEIIAYDLDGARVWKTATSSITPAAPQGVGTPISLIASSDGELIGATPQGWVVKLDPVDGSTIDAYEMATNIFVDGELIPGVFINRNGLNLNGNILYLLVEFLPDPPGLLSVVDRPVHIVRLELSQPGEPGMERRIRPLVFPLAPWEPTPDRIAIGFGAGGGSPASMTLTDGRMLIVGDADVRVGQESASLVSAVVDDNGVLRERWRSLLGAEQVTASPALDAAGRTLIVGTLANLYVFRYIDVLSGFVPPPSPLQLSDLITCGQPAAFGATSVLGSPIAIAFDDRFQSLVAYTNFRIAQFASPFFSYLGAFAVPINEGGTPVPLWCEPLAVDADGNPAPGLGTFGQIALFEYDVSGVQESGLIVNTSSTGTFIMRSDDSPPPIFVDGFESGSTSAWSSAVGGL